MPGNCFADDQVAIDIDIDLFVGAVPLAGDYHCMPVVVVDDYPRFSRNQQHCCLIIHRYCEPFGALLIADLQCQ